MKANNRKEPAYITKRILLQTSYRAVNLASKKAMRIAGYIVKVQNECVVREYKDGTIQEIERLSPKVKPQEIILD
jgi:hypothetical protein